VKTFIDHQTFLRSVSSRPDFLSRGVTIAFLKVDGTAPFDNDKLNRLVIYGATSLAQSSINHMGSELVGEVFGDAPRISFTAN